MKRVECLRLAFCVLPCLVLAGLAHAQKSGRLERLLIGGPADMPPYAYMDSAGVYTGYSVDIMHAAGEIMGVENVLFYPALPDQSLKNLSQGTINCIHFIRYSPDLARDFTFAAFYMESSSVIFVPNERYDIANLEDLQGKRVAILREDPAYEDLRKIKSYYTRQIESPEKAFQMLHHGKVDAYIGERLTSLHYLGKQGMEKKFKIVGSEVSHSRFGVLTRKQDEELSQKLEKAYQILDKTGKRDRIFYQWFGENFHAMPFLSRQTIRWVMIFVVTSLLVAMIVLGWNLLLQRELELKAVAVEKAELHRKIAEEKTRFEAIVQSMTEGLMLVDPNGAIAYVNAPGAQYLGRRAEDLLMHPLTVISEHLLSKVKDPENLIRKLELAELNPTRPTVIEYTVTTTKRQDIRLKLFPVRDRHGDFAGRGILIEDITHEREVERLKSEFVSIASHELRTPMTSILGFSEILLNKSLPADMLKRYLNQIHSEAERLTRILNDMLDLSYLESGEGVIEKKPVNVMELVNEVVDNFRAQIKDRREIRVACNGHIPVVMLDRDKIVQVLWNLLSNADKYSFEGRKVLIDITLCHLAEPEWRLSQEETEMLLPAAEIQVTDFGEGIAQDQLSLIFIPFYRVETAVHTIRGTGLGLSIVKRIVEAHGGRVWAFSEPGSKTVFTVLIPLEKS
ncbi:transporter substrate-binding domain-containing protein [candidate division FCPU426 bacterium]|nr:transporter substrate-binding domain-containing protein [candidate division FCPU426 bacterium]